MNTQERERERESSNARARSDQYTQSWGDAPIVKKTMELYRLYYGYVELFPKKDKYHLGAACERYLLQTLELLLEASYLPVTQKRVRILSANTKFETLKVLIRLLKELKVLDQKKYLALQSLIQEIGKMLGGWIRSLPS